MIVHAQIVNGQVQAVFSGPQPDALDSHGNVICEGVPTVEMEDDHPDVVAFNEAAMRVEPHMSAEALAKVLKKNGLISTADADQARAESNTLFQGGKPK